MYRVWGILLVLMLVIIDATPAGAEPIGRAAFQRIWERADSPVQRSVARRSWLWGPEPFTPVLREAYLDASGKRRIVQYFDKARMEITNPEGNTASDWYVSTGLLVSEMILGRVEIGTRHYVPLPSPAIPVAGDQVNTFPTYATLRRFYGVSREYERGDNVTTLLSPDGLDQLDKYANTPATEIVRLERGLGIPRVFWEFLTRTGTIHRNGQDVSNQPVINSWIFVMGLPVTEAMWVKVKVRGVEREVLVQAFERRVLTYTPSNVAGLQVELGNVGRHYYRWRYIDPFLRSRRALITTPRANALVSGPLRVQGFENGRAFEGAIEVRLKTKADGEVLDSVATTVWRADVARPGPFEATLNYPPSIENRAAIIEVITTSANDGSEIVLARTEVTLRAVELDH